MASLLSKQRILAPPGYNRWRVPFASVAIHLCIGSVYAWSLFNSSLTRLDGVVAGAPEDWSLRQVVWIFTVAIVFLGLSAALAGPWLERVGPRMVGTVAAACWGGGFLIAGLGLSTRQLWLLYLGYGVIGGFGLGLGYVSPVSTLLRWFPDRRGMAAGLAIMGFGGGAMVATPLKERLIQHYFRAPVHLGTSAEVELENREGRLFAEVDGRAREVVVLNEKEASQLPVRIPEGIYLVGTGRTGVAQTFLTLGLLYGAIMLIAAFSFRIPAPGWKPDGWAGPVATASRSPRRMITAHDVGPDEALRTPQFYLLWVVLCMNVTAGIGVLGVAKTMMTEIFGSALPDLVTSGFAATYVLMISLFNMAGRFFWASVSDAIGRKLTYTIFFVGGIFLYLMIPLCAVRVGVSHSVVWLLAFYGLTMLIFTMYGGGFATIPAYLADLFGLRYVGAIHGRLLTAWSFAGVLGPLATTSLRERELARSLRGLAARIPPDRFRSAFGAGIDQLDQLAATKTVTLARLMELAPPGTVDPSTTLYNSTMYLMAALLGVALVANLLVRPVDPRHHLSAGPPS